MSRILAVAGHDLKQPISLAMLSIGRAVDEGVSAAAAHRLSIALDALKRLVGEMNHIARLSQMNAALAPKRTVVLTSEILTRVEREWRFYAELCGAHLKVCTSELLVQTDPEMLHSIIRNLVWNAVKYCGPGGHVRVSCRRKRNWIRIEVEDNGCGIPAARLDGIFNAFERGDQAGRSEGLGLGLMIVRQTADLLQHLICVRSIENEGSVFSVQLPLYLSEYGHLQEGSIPP
jgi:signal transduction histidine kinase